MTLAEIAWTKSQRHIIELPADARALVVADAGTGKTAAVAERLARLVSNEGVAPGTEVLLLSFTRSAVGEIKNRLSRTGGRSAYARVATFDSFATRLLSAHDPEDRWIELDYDGRIMAAVELLGSNTEAAQELASIRHVFVDEIQDLVGIRADFVLAVLQSSGGGFTLLGDPAQAIFNFSDEHNHGDQPLFQRVRYLWQDDLIERTFEGNHRAETESARTALGFGPALRREDPDYAAVRDGLLGRLRQLPKLGGVAAAAAGLKSPHGSTAVLCRTGGEALVISSELSESDVAHRLQREATERVIAPWVARVLLELEAASIGRRLFDDLVERRMGRDFDIDEAWSLLRRLNPSSQTGLDIERIRERLSIGYVPDELTAQPSAAVVVSTIHRAKGLGFDSVIILEPRRLEELDDGSNELADEVRTLYVAMTRPRKSILRMPIGPPSNVRLDKPSKRWYRGSFQPWQTFGFEVRGSDAHHMDPARDPSDGGRSSREIQDYLWEEVGPGDPLQMTFIDATTEGRIVAFYAIRHAGNVVGVTSREFGVALNSRLRNGGNKRGRWPMRIDGLTTEGIDTVAGTRAAGDRAGLSGGIWLRIRPGGLGEFEW